MIRVFIGYDSREVVAYSVLAHSINARASRPVAVAPVMLGQLEGVFRRERNPLQSTEFSFSRFLVPWMCAFEGWAIFMDCDMLVRADIANLWEMRDERFAVQVVQHEHVPKEDVKFLGAVQTKYQKKNWSSVMLMNCARCTALTPEYVNQASGLELHQFKWLGDDALIGALPSGWNHLVGYDPPRADASLVHFTIGGPWFEEYRDAEHAGEWFAERERMLGASRRDPVAAAS
jgi:hypothetical protein